MTGVQTCALPISYDAENLQTGLLGWQVVAIVIDVVLAAGLIALEAAAIKKYKKRSAEV